MSHIVHLEYQTELTVTAGGVTQLVEHNQNIDLDAEITTGVTWETALGAKVALFAEGAAPVPAPAPDPEVLFYSTQTLANNLFLRAKTLAGVSKDLIGVDATDVLQIDGDALGVNFGGAVSVAGTAKFSGAVGIGTTSLPANVSATIGTVASTRGWNWAKSSYTNADASVDETMVFGYNITAGTAQVDATEFSAFFGLESNFLETDAYGVTHNQIEGYVRVKKPAGALREPWFFLYDRDRDLIHQFGVRGERIFFRDTAGNESLLLTKDLANFLGAGQFGGKLGVGAAAPAYAQILLNGILTNSEDAGNAYGLYIDTGLVLNPKDAGDAIGAVFAPRIGRPTGGAVTNGGTLELAAPTFAGTGTVANAYTLKISSAPTAGTSSNYALYVAAGKTRLDGQLGLGGSPVAYARVQLTGGFAPGANGAYGVFADTNFVLQPGTENDAHGMYLGPRITRPSGGTVAHGGTVTLDAPGFIGTGAVTEAWTLKVASAPTAGTSLNYALWVAAGNTNIATTTYADDAAAAAGGLTAGTIYKTATGELRIKL